MRILLQISICVSVAYLTMLVPGASCDAPIKKTPSFKKTSTFNKTPSIKKASSLRIPLEFWIKNINPHTEDAIDSTDDYEKDGKRCDIHVRDLPRFHPWILHPRTHHIVHPRKEDILTLWEGDEVQLFCSGQDNYLNQLREVDSEKMNVAIVKCEDGRISYLNQVMDVYVEWSCERIPETTIRKMSDKIKCHDDQLPVYRVGFWIKTPQPHFTTIYDLCVDNRNPNAMRAIYAVYKMRSGGLEGAEHVKLRGVMKTAVLKTFADESFSAEPSFTEILRRAENEHEVNQANRMKYAPYFLCPAEDLYYLAEQLSTYIVANIAYQWVPLHRHNWKVLNEDIRDFARTHPSFDLTIYSGVLGRLKLEDPPAEPNQIPEEKAEKLAPVPGISWKMLIVEKQNKGITFLAHNKFVAPPAKTVCADQTANLTWVKNLDKDPEKGLVYACHVNKFRKLPSVVPIAGKLPSLQCRRFARNKVDPRLP